MTTSDRKIPKQFFPLKKRFNPHSDQINNSRSQSLALLQFRFLESKFVGKGTHELEMMTLW